LFDTHGDSFFTGPVLGCNCPKLRAAASSVRPLPHLQATIRVLTNRPPGLRCVPCAFTACMRMAITS